MLQQPAAAHAAQHARQPVAQRGIQRLPPAAQAPSAADIDWRQYFTDPRLQRLIGMALGNNRDLRLAMLNVEQARAQFQIRRADEYPTVAGIASATRSPLFASPPL